MTVESRARLPLAPEVAAWAEAAFPFEEAQQVTRRPWAQTYVLRAGAKRAFLKLVPPSRGRALVVTAALATRYPDLVPRVLAMDAAGGRILVSDHGGRDLGGGLTPGQSLRLLQRYAELQRDASHHERLLALLPALDLAGLYPRFLRFLAMEEEGEAACGASAFLGSAVAQRYAKLFASLSDLCEPLLRQAAALPQSVNHCDLRGENVAERPDGSLRLFDWDEALRGPVGLSLRTLFGGAYRPFIVLQRLTQLQEAGPAKVDRRLLNGYIEVLQRDPAFPAQQLVEGLPGSLLAGLLHFICSFADYPPPDQDYRRDIARVLRRKLDDLLMVVEAATRLQPAALDAVKAALEAAEEAPRLRRLTGGLRPEPEAPEAYRPPDHPWLQRALPPEAFPSIAVGPLERALGSFREEQVALAASLFDTHGVLLIEGAIPQATLEACLAHLPGPSEAALTVGDKRTMRSLDFAAPFSDAALLLSPFVAPLLQRLLGRDLILGSMTAVTSEVGAEEQRLHRDHHALYPELPVQDLPPFAITMLVPLFTVSEAAGPTRVVKGSHRHPPESTEALPRQQRVFPAGACLLMNYLLDHQGMANHSQQARPMLSYVFQRAWFRDAMNFKKQAPLQLSRADLASLAQPLRPLVAWAVQSDSRSRVGGRATDQALRQETKL
ncbi:MAG: hypothetical protein Kilf2KO_36120 [Rhodospirillales bacterium]